MAIDSGLIKRFAALYTGYEKAYGQFRFKKTNERGKATGRTYTVSGQVGLEQYKAHLEGTGVGLGIIMLRDDDTCRYGVIDVDNPKGTVIDHAAIEKKIIQLGLPLTVLRSKSGGAHLTVFTKEPVFAVVLQAKLSEWAALLGYSSKTEIFPKQCSRVNDIDVGNWVNLPYYGGELGDDDNPFRCAYFQGKSISLEEFLDLAESRLTGEYDFTEVKYGQGDPGDHFFEGPPCLQHLLGQGGFMDGTKRMGMFDVGVYLRKRYPEDWSIKIHTYNTTMCTPPLRNEEIQDLIKSLGKKDYGYQCKQPPISDHCQRKLCLSRMFGVGDDGPQSAGLEISAITCYMVEDTDDAPMWGMEIAGKRILIDNNTFYERDSFNKACLAMIHRVPIHIPPARWVRMVDELAANADVVLTPTEVSNTGNLWEWIVSYLTGAKATALDQVAVGGAYLEDGVVFFRVLDLFRFLDVQRVEYKNKQTIYHLLKKHGGESKFQNFRKGSCNIWHLPAPAIVPKLESGKDEEQVPF